MKLAVLAVAAMLVLSGCSLVDDVTVDAVDPNEQDSNKQDNSDFTTTDPVATNEATSSRSEDESSDEQQFPPPPTVSSTWGSPATVERVIDGDSVELAVAGEVLEVRLPGFNAPELYGEANAKTCQGSEAKQALQTILQDGSIRFLAEEQDRYGRTLGQLAVDERLVIESLISQGWGLSTGAEPTQRELMKQAAAGRRGIWGGTCGQPISGDLSVTETHVDAEGNDRFNLTDEWVEISNSGDETIDLSGWVIRDETFGHRFELAGRLDPGATLRVRSGEGTGSTKEMYLGERYPVWSNSGETIVLVDPTGVFVHWLFVD